MTKLAFLLTLLFENTQNRYYHCAPGWVSPPLFLVSSYLNAAHNPSQSSVSEWPLEKDYWLDWLPLYDYALGEPNLAVVTRSPSGESIYSRTFSSGTRVQFDSSTGVGVIYWAKLALGRWYPCVENNCVTCGESKECWQGFRENYLGGAKPHCGECWHALYMGRLGSPP